MFQLQNAYIGLRDRLELLGVSLQKPIYALANINGVNTSKNSLDVNIKTVHTSIIDQEFNFKTNVYTMFSSPVIAQDRTFTVIDASGFTVRDKIQIEDGIVETDYPSILSITGNTITIDRPIDKNYTTLDGIRKIISNMNVDGSVTPVSFKVRAETAITASHIRRLLIAMTHEIEGDGSTFGGIPELTRGVLFRAYYERTGEYKTIANWKTNSDIASHMYDMTNSDRADKKNLFSTSGRWTITQSGAVAELQPNNIDFLEFLIQDDLTGLATFKIRAQGHIL